MSFSDAPSLFSELARLTRWTPSIERSRATTVATRAWLGAQPMRSIAGTGSAARSEPPPPPASAVLGATVPTSEVRSTSPGTARATSRRLCDQSKRPSSSPSIVSTRALRSVAVVLPDCSAAALASVSCAALSTRASSACLAESWRPANALAPAATTHIGEQRQQHVRAHAGAPSPPPPPVPRPRLPSCGMRLTAFTA